MSSSDVPVFKLNDGHSIPALGYGLGTARMSGGSRKSSDLDTSLVELTNKAIKTGFLHLDGAQWYGNEQELGEAVRASGVPRESIFVTTKYSSHKAPAPETFAASLAKLGLDYVDLYLIHTPWTENPEQLKRAWADLEAIKASGKARSIGVSNFLQEHLEVILEGAKVVPAVNQVEFHPYLQHGDLLDFHKKHGITTAAYGPLTPVVRGVEGEVVPIWERLAGKYGVSTSEIGLRWCIDQGVVAVTTSSSEERLRNYITKIPTFTLTADEIKEISDAGRKGHYRAFFTDRYAADDKR